MGLDARCCAARAMRLRTSSSRSFSILGNFLSISPGTKSDFALVVYDGGTQTGKSHLPHP